MTKRKNMKKPQPADVHVGGRIQMRRLQLHLSQVELGKAFGRRYGQVQRYEKGTNRVSASVLQMIANRLGVPTSFFFDGMPTSTSTVHDADANFVRDCGRDKDVHTLALTFPRIKSPRMRAVVIGLVEEMSPGLR